ncbi:hypothetical protein G7B40_018790 [Aetokthonos hydrillicola Thurmond2011]|jgi:ABC-type proline/glycine betaine transport system substrate-binding protein|uniref:Ribbon-helix-helix protein CopG domain-containing protein n=1 Tax=Aetokthonos hydrillicola Thurmond2011 TaxID=2712845 RepID=A0AAP5IBC3_9CYAN|nr:hypothetical protein [Aetokthonos hydrillicola]MBO3463659.1 DNA-binding protein [Aetokthonos hydrillicola CCALA 1050]MBW4585272.1 hypothetical protein [Aetokthonos hydrillicola CCALA 1050]MDR9896593.1 hypothetical protein [Aetokthonos hydrillicola Thurmond2011]
MRHRDKWLNVQLTEDEMKKLTDYASKEGWTKSQAVREWIKNLPCY